MALVLVVIPPSCTVPLGSSPPTWPGVTRALVARAVASRRLSGTDGRKVASSPAPVAPSRLSSATDAAKASGRRRRSRPIRVTSLVAVVSPLPLPDLGLELASVVGDRDARDPLREVAGRVVGRLTPRVGSTVRTIGPHRLSMDLSARRRMH